MTPRDSQDQAELVTLELLTVDKVVCMLRTSRKMVNHRIARGQIPAVRLGRTMLVRRGDLAAEFGF